MGRSYQIDINFRMAKRSTATVAGNHSIVDRFRRDFGDQLHSNVRIDFFSFIRVADQTVIFFVPGLKKEWSL